MRPSRRAFLASGAALAAAGLPGCAGPGGSFLGDGGPFQGRMFGPLFGSSDRDLGFGRILGRPDYARAYGPIAGERFPVAAFRFGAVDPEFLRGEVAYAGAEPVGTIVVDPRARFLYRVDGEGRATRYGVGVGREGFGWSGEAHVNLRRDWPDWVPPREMVERDPEIRAQLTSTSRGLGKPGGTDNPLGARALYLAANGADTGYRIHGTTEPETIGTSVSSGCIRMVNQDVIHLYHRTPDGARVFVLA